MITLNKENQYNIIIVGVGGTGSHLVSFLSQLIGNNRVYQFYHKIVLVDADEVETKNLRTQKFLASDVGKNKAEILADRYESVFGTDILYVDQFIESGADIERLLSKEKGTCNIVVSCVDNNKARKVMDDYFNSDSKVSNDLIYIDTGNSSGTDELTGQTVIGYKKDRKIVLPSVSTFFPQILEEEEPVQTVSCGEIMTTNIQNIGANITSACTVFNILNNIIGYDSIPGDLFLFNATKIQTESMAINTDKVEDLREIA